MSKGNIDNEFNAHQSGGQLFKFDEENMDFTRWFSSRKLGQEETHHYKIVKINIYKLNQEILSKGHRNPQGLPYNKNDFIISTEHGPHGGDEQI